MPKYEVVWYVEGTEVYEVEAASAEAAKDLVDDYDSERHQRQPDLSRFAGLVEMVEKTEGCDVRDIIVTNLDTLEEEEF